MPPLRVSNHLYIRAITSFLILRTELTPDIFVEVSKTCSKQIPGRESKEKSNRYLQACFVKPRPWATRLGISKFTTSDTFGMSSLSGN